MTASATPVKDKASRRLARMDAVLKRLQERDLDILQSLYVARSITTRQIAAAFFRHDWNRFPKGGLGTACERRLALLAEWGLITFTPTGGTLVGGWEETALTGKLCPWGRAVTITMRGIRLLLQKGRLPEIAELEDGTERVGYKTAAQIRPKRSSHKHTFLTAGAVLRAVHQSPSAYKWVGSRDLQKANTGRPWQASFIPAVPDALIQTERVAWAVEGDKGTIHVPTLLSRWQKVLPIWGQVQTTGLHLPDHYGAPAPLAGILWYCAATSAVALRNRVRRLRAEAVDPKTAIVIPHGLGWYVDSFDGLAWTYKHFLGPWSEGLGLHPQEFLERRVASVAGPKHGLILIAALGDLGGWQKVQAWISEAKLSRKYPPVIVLVRDGVEAQQLWELGVADDSTGTTVKRMAFLLPPLVDPVPRLDANKLAWKPDPEGTWRESTLRDIQTAYRNLKG